MKHVSGGGKMLRGHCRCYNIVTRFARQRDNNNVDSSDLTRKFIGTIVEITHNSYNTHFRV
jgi:hypothetical protein